MIPSFVIFLMAICVVIFIVRVVALIKINHGYIKEDAAAWAGSGYVITSCMIGMVIGYSLSAKGVFE